MDDDGRDPLASRRLVAIVTIDGRIRAAWRWVATDQAARVAWYAALALCVPTYYLVGRHQWFVRDDWAFLLTRNDMRAHGVAEWLLIPQDGHWMTPPLLAYRAIDNLFGLDSYWPFLLPTMALHVTAVVLTRVLCRRVGASPWTTTLVCSMLLVFGAGWENIVFAVQITYNLSLVAFLAHVVLVDHDGPLDRRDAAGSAVAVIGVMSSGFGPFFVAGAFVLLALRRRWVAALVAAGPATVIYAWWFVAWQQDKAAERLGGDRAEVPAFVVRGVAATFESLSATERLAGIALLATLAIALWPGAGRRAHTHLVTMWSVVILMFLVVGWQRIGFGIDAAGNSRYQHIAAMLLAPAFALAVDQLRRIGEPALAAGRVIVAVAALVNAGWLYRSAQDWATGSRDAKLTFELVLGSPLASTVEPTVTPVPFSPDVTVARLPQLADRGAIEARVPVTDDELRRVRMALGLEPAPADAGGG